MLLGRKKTCGYCYAHAASRRADRRRSRSRHRVGLRAGSVPANADTPSGTVSIDKSFDYKCNLFAALNKNDPMEIANDPNFPFVVNVRAQSTVPGTVYAGQSIAPTPTTITLHLDDNLWNATAILTGGGWNIELSGANTPGMSRSLDGYSDDSSIGFTVAGHRTDVPINDLRVDNAPIPGKAAGSAMVPESPWLVPTAGTVAKIDVPASAAGQSATLQMPHTFTAFSTLLNGSVDANDPTAGHQDYYARLDCTLPDAVDGSLLANPIPIVAPATTSISAPSTVTPFAKSAVLSYAVQGVDAGTVDVLDGAKVLSTSTFSAGHGSVKLPVLPVGSHRLTLKYAGRYGALASSTTSTVTVAKVAASISSATIAPKTIKAKKTAPKLSVSVTSAAGAPTGTVTVTLKARRSVRPRSRAARPR